MKLDKYLGVAPDGRVVAFTENNVTPKDVDGITYVKYDGPLESQEILRKNLLHMVVDGVLVETDQPIYPPPNKTFWNPAVRAWQDPRTGVQKRTEALAELRGERDRLLAECDWTQLLDAPVDAEVWRRYRQALRDLPQQHPNILSIAEVVWPRKPT